MTSRAVVTYVLAASSLLLTSTQESQASEIQSKTQGYSLQLDVSNVGTFGSLSQVLSYAPWVGGLVDTSMSGNLPTVKIVTTGNEGWAGPLFEFAPGTDLADTIWEAGIASPVEPPGWSDYWGAGFPFDPVSQQDYYCRYRDNESVIPLHVPLDLQIVQSSYAWENPEAEGIIIVEYRITTTRDEIIQECWFGMFLESSQGSSIAGFSADGDLSYFLPVDPQQPAIGAALLHSSVNRESLDVSFAWYEGPASPSTDSSRYNTMSSRIIMPEQDPPGFVRSLLSFGPFSLTVGDTIIMAIALLSGDDIDILRERASAARTYYLFGGIPTPVDSGYPQPLQFALSQNFPNPFNPETEIGFQVTDYGFVSLRIYDMLGREVATLVNESLFPGDYEVEFDGRDLASGAYYYRLTAGSNTLVKRMMLIR